MLTKLISCRLFPINTNLVRLSNTPIVSIFLNIIPDNSRISKFFVSFKKIKSHFHPKSNFISFIFLKRLIISGLEIIPFGESLVVELRKYSFKYLLQEKNDFISSNVKYFFIIDNILFIEKIVPDRIGIFLFLFSFFFLRAIMFLYE